MILTSTNADRGDINKQVRERLESGGAVDSGKEYRTFQKADLNAVSRNFSSSYHEGQAIIFKNDCEEIKRGAQTTVIKIDEEKNTITVKYFDKESKSSKEAVVDCRGHCAKMQVYDVVEKKFGIGDRVIFQKNDKAVDVKNGQTGVIKSIDEEGNARIDVGKSGTVECNLNNRGNRAYTYIDHAYCITSHKSQGSTYDKCIAVYDVSNHKTNFNEFYVAATRQREDVSIYTNSKEKFKEQAQEEQDKISTLDPVFRKFEGRMRENREEVARETKEKLAAIKVGELVEEKQSIQLQREQQAKQQEKKPEKPKQKERDIGMDL